jgi:hypothetical protein
MIPHVDTRLAVWTMRCACIHLHEKLEQLRSRRADAVGPDPKVHVATLEEILSHCAEHPTIYLPSHDPESLARLAGAVIVS